MLFLCLELVVFSIVGQGFFSLNGVQIVLFYGTSLFLLATAETFVIVTGGIDLSVGFIMGFSTVISAMLVAAIGNGGDGAVHGNRHRHRGHTGHRPASGPPERLPGGKAARPALPGHLRHGRHRLRDLPSCSAAEAK